MTKNGHAPRSGTSLGKRLAELRRERGYPTARALSLALEGSGITESVIQNIEAGRKPDISVSQLLNLAMALRTSPLFLLAAYGRPLDAVDLPNLSPSVAALTNAELDAWVSGWREPRMGASFDEITDVAALEVFRELNAAVDRYADIIERLETERLLRPDSPELERFEVVRRRARTEIAQLRGRAYGTASWLDDTTWSVDGFEDG